MEEGGRRHAEGKKGNGVGYSEVSRLLKIPVNVCYNKPKRSPMHKKIYPILLLINCPLLLGLHPYYWSPPGYRNFVIAVTGR